MNTKKIIFASFICLLFLSGILMSNSDGESNKNDIDNLTYNDISYLWPVPKNTEDVEKLLSANTVIGSTTIWPEESFNKVLNRARSLKIPKGPKGSGYKSIKFVYHSDSALLKRKNWKVVGFRIDPSAPSTSDTNVIGIIPQIRLVLQPVTLDKKGVVTVHDFAVHLPFSYTLSGNIHEKKLYVADTVTFKEIINDIIILKKYLESTSKVPSEEVLQVNKGLANKVPGYAKKIEAFLSKHIPKGELNFIAFMGLAPRPEPWIFFSMLTGEKFQILSTMDSDSTAGKPIRKNTNWKDGASVSTAILYQMKDSTDPRLDSLAISKKQIPLNKDIPNIIANPDFCNVFNTDCISCHSESTRRSLLGLEENVNYKFSSENLVKKELLPTGIYNVRNFGWFGNVTDMAKPIISMRTANETANVLEYIKKNYSTP
jgi:hypothetical protein